MSSKERSFSVGIDFARALACFLVVVVHLSASDFYLFGPRWWPANFYDSIARVAVPIFFLITGALVLVPEEKIGRFYKKRIGKVLLPLIVWSTIYALIYRNASAVDSVVNILGGLSAGHLWYFYAIIGLYLSAPFLGKIYRNSNLNEKRLFLLFWFSCNCIVPFIQPFLDSNYDPRGPYHLQMFVGYFGFLFLGAYLSERCRDDVSTGWLLANGVGVVFGCGITMWLTYAFSVKAGRPIEAFYTYLSLFIVVAAVCLFNITLSIRKLPPVIGSIVNVISTCSLGIYCIHPLVIDVIGRLTGLESRITSTWLKIPIMTLAVFFVSLAVIYVLRKLPFTRRFI
jgi:surface polysaccharide O-acyltransferase-like enzyme